MELRLLNFPIRGNGVRLDWKVQQKRAEAFSVGIERKRARNAGRQRTVQDEIKYSKLRQFKALDLALDDGAEKIPHRLDGNLRGNQIIGDLIEGDCPASAPMAQI